MIKAIRILEVPLLLLIMAVSDLQEISTGWFVFLITISITRLIINVVTDDIIYRQ